MRQDVQEWFAARSYNARQWSREQLLARKEGRTVSVVLPARDEAETVGTIVAALRRELVEAVPLIDELVVIDSDSTDDTARVARPMRVRISHHANAMITTIDTPMLTTSVIDRRIGPSPGIVEVAAPGRFSVPPPMNIWKM